jgi:hypothetical protein
MTQEKIWEGTAFDPLVKRPETTSHLCEGSIADPESILVQAVILFKARGLLSVSLLSVSFTRKDKMHSSKTLLYHTYLLFQMCTALAAPTWQSLLTLQRLQWSACRPPFVRSSADGQFNRRQVRSCMMCRCNKKPGCSQDCSRLRRCH